jgi:hypothetical protein
MGNELASNAIEGEWGWKINERTRDEIREARTDALGAA